MSSNYNAILSNREDDLEEGNPAVNFRHFSVSHLVCPVEDDVDSVEEEEEKVHFVKDVSSGQSYPSSNNYHGVLQVVVPNEHRKFYEMIWMPKIFKILTSMTGFRNRFVEVRASGSHDDCTEYVVVLIFDSFENYKAWTVSEERKKVVAELSDKHIVVTAVNAYGGSIGGAEISPDDESLVQARISSHNTINKVPSSLPPPKWKLAIIITIEVYIALTLVNLSGSVDAMLAADMPLGLVLFLSVSHVVLLLTYAGLPLLMSVPIVNKWLRMARRCDPSQMHPLHAVLDQGLQIFSVKMKPQQVPHEVLSRIKTLESRVDKLLEMNKSLQAEVNTLQTVTSPLLSPANKLEDDAFEDVVANKAAKIASDRQSSSNLGSDRSAPLTMAVRHYIKWEYQIDFINWTKEMDDEMRKFKGYEGMISIRPQNDGDPYINSFTFSTFEDLMVFCQSSGRKALLCKLKPMLEAASDYEMGEERNFSDAFTELCVPTGEKAQMRPPPVWKTAILTIIPLHIVVWQCGNNIKPYLTRNITMDDHLLLFIVTCINVFINSYIALPLMLSQFGDWLHMPRVPRLSDGKTKNKLLLLDFFEDGLSFPFKIAFVLVFIAINLLLGYL